MFVYRYRLCITRCIWILLVSTNFQQIVSTNFLSVGSVPISPVSTSESVCQSNEECFRPRRELLPGSPKKLPLSCIPENAAKMKEWLQKLYFQHLSPPNFAEYGRSSNCNLHRSAISTCCCPHSFSDSFELAG